MRSRALTPQHPAATDALEHQPNQSESFLCSFSANLTEDLAEALRDAWPASTVGHRPAAVPRLGARRSGPTSRAGFAFVARFAWDNPLFAGLWWETGSWRLARKIL